MLDVDKKKLSEVMAALGRVKSKKKAAASRRNGRKATKKNRKRV